MFYTTTYFLSVDNLFTTNTRLLKFRLEIIQCLVCKIYKALLTQNYMFKNRTLASNSVYTHMQISIYNNFDVLFKTSFQTLKCQSMRLLWQYLLYVKEAIILTMVVYVIVTTLL